MNEDRPIPIRDYFAGQALQGIIVIHMLLQPASGEVAERNMQYIAKIAYSMADQMMKVRIENV